MRIPLIFLSLIVSALFTSTQAQTYHLTVTNEPFVFLENVQLATEEAWDEPVYQVPIGFDFEFFDITSDQFYSIENSFFGAGALNNDVEHLYALMPFYASLIDRGSSQDSALSPISYQTEGPVGQRIFTLEYKEAGLFFGEDTDDGIYLEYISFQVKLYEDSGDIEFHYGPYFIQTGADTIFDPFEGPIIGLIKDVDWNTFGGHVGELILLEGDPLDPILTDSITSLGWPIPENTVYRFSKMGTSVADHQSDLHQPLFFPNPTSGDLHLHAGIAKDVIYPIYVIDVLGKPVCEWNSEVEISALDITAGSYYAVVRTQSKVVTEKLLVLPD